MERQTIDYGIDLGTTNSEIAVMDHGTHARVIENNYNERTTPSAVACTKKGQILVGKTAYMFFVSHRWEDVDNVHIQFKRRMGTDDKCLFPYCGKAYTPEELSAEVLKELRASVERRCGESIGASVISIPAAFEQPQIAATKRAAEKAGLIQCELIQEPVAAALSYGMLEANAEGYWLVYDLGGGTFDAALLQLNQGTIRVVNHCGDNYLGGKDIDNAILDRIIMPTLAKDVGLDDFNRGNPRWKYAISRLRYFVEMAKIELTKSNSVDFHIDYIFDPEKNDKIYLEDFEYELTQSELSPLYSTVIEKTLNYIKNLLQESHLSNNAIEKIILVGGPTQYPLIREALSSSLKAPLDFSRDVMTVVAEGAAVFAGSRKIIHKTPLKASKDSVLIELNYEPSGADPEPTIGGIVKLSADKKPESFSIEIIGIKSQWRSGKIALAPNGAFMISALADKGLNEYKIELRDQSGNLIKTTPETLTYNLTGIDIQAKTLMHNISISNPDGTPDIILRKGMPLPVKGSVICLTDHLIGKDSSDALIIKLFEGNNTLNALRNKLIGELRIGANQFPRDLPANQEVEIKIRLDENGNIEGTAEVLIFDLEEPYQIVWNTQNIYESIKYQELERMMEGLLDRLTNLQSSSTGDSITAGIFLRIESEDLINQIKETLKAAKTDPDQASKCHNLLLHLGEMLDDAENRKEMPALEKRAHLAIQNGKQIIAEENSAKDALIYNSLEKEISDAIKESDKPALERAVEKLESFIHSIYAKYPAWWVAIFRSLEQDIDIMEDKAKANILFAQGRTAIANNDFDSLQQAVRQLIKLLPIDVQNKSDLYGNVWVRKVN
jgi:molecular chaperone DnaK